MMLQEYVIASMYQFDRLEAQPLFQPRLLAFCQERDIKGTILLAEEGVNGTVAGSRTAINELRQYLKSDLQLQGLEYKESYADTIPFQRIKVKLKKEIVSMGHSLKLSARGGVRLESKDWNKLIREPDVLLIDVRNEYEHQIGTFKDAVSPKTKNFRQFPAYVAQQLDPASHKKIAMFCTGGIRCEKASAYMLEKGFEAVYQLSGGILKYLEEISVDESLWGGECFVFDARVSVDHQLARGRYLQCFACRRPLSDEALNSKDYQKGISCPYCIYEKSPKQRAAFRERQRQVELAEKRNERHIGANVSIKI